MYCFSFNEFPIFSLHDLKKFLNSPSEPQKPWHCTCAKSVTEFNYDSSRVQSYIAIIFILNMLFKIYTSLLFRFNVDLLRCLIEIQIVSLGCM